MKNGNPPHDKHDRQVDSVDMKFGMQYNELYEVRFIKMYFKVGKLKTHVWCLKKILTQLLLNLVLSLSQLGVYLGKYIHIIMNIFVRSSTVVIGGFRHKRTWIRKNP